MEATTLDGMKPKTAHTAIGGKRLGQIEPRERVGSQTGRKYEYQYERTAIAALATLVDNKELVSVYCDWHDDYVIEMGAPPTQYVFHQVKGRKSSQGPWTFREFFGVPLREENTQTNKPALVNKTAIVPLMLLHYGNFCDSCAGLAFVTNAGLDPSLAAFLTSVGSSKDETALPNSAKNAFNHLARAYVSANPKHASSATELFRWLLGITVHIDQGQIEGSDAALLEIADVIVNYSEIDLTVRQSKQIAREIVGLVRLKVAHSTTVVPVSDKQLQQDKGIVVDDILGLLSLSAPAYEALKSGAGSDTVKTLSRLERFCKSKGFDEHLVYICNFKSKWDIWRTIERHNLKSSDYVLLEDRAHEVLKNNLTMSQVINNSKDIAKQFKEIFATDLEPEHVLGLIFSLAAQAESPAIAGNNR
ncbi:dsDNA nuclease domain-containing protein [Xanthomonas cannabis]|uniref:dsDNA nuclease domain-containing protein n=1 Tax=Xanthomonas cannabis TaxID=1885674 RepID=UPI00141A7D02|nr:dsDNA nuclease domain-containing protein [Xanthomonas cannabis]NIK63519.1 hypothetical protein [Xanthomonas cannabis]